MSRESYSTAEGADRDAPGDVLVEVENLRSYYGGGGLFAGPPVKAVDGVSFDIKKGETLGLVGESGCGKTTLGRTLIRLKGITDGTVRFDGTDITTMTGEERRRWRQNTQMVFQDPDSSLNDRITVGEIVREPLDVYDWQTPRDRRRRVRELLDTVGLQPQHYYRYPHQFSGGQRQRIGIARALALNPEFIVLDEPVSALDTSVQAQILNLLEDLQEEFGLTYLFIAHDLSVVRHICDRVAVMYLGKIMELGPAEELFEDPANPYTHSLLSAIPEPDPHHRKRRITLRGTPPSPRNPPSGCVFTTRCPMKIRPEEFADIDQEAWNAIEEFREVLRERSRAERSLRERAKKRLGMETRFTDIEDVRRETFANVDLPPEAREHVDRTVELVSDNREAEARSYLAEAFESVCDAEEPADHVVSDAGRVSHCHRHLPEYADPDEFLAEELGVSPRDARARQPTVRRYEFWSDEAGDRADRADRAKRGDWSRPS